MCAYRANLAGIEAVAPRLSFFQHLREVGIDRRARRPVCEEAMHLWMMTVTTRLATQHCAREQRFAPQGHEALGIKVLRM
jgi:hypothetical protein